MEEIQAILEEWENDREATLTYLESHGDDVFDSVMLSASRTGPVLKKTVLDYVQVWSLRFARSDRGLCVCV